MTTEPLNLNAEIAKLEAEVNAVVALSSVTPRQREALRQRLRQLKEKAGV
jgi:hypothetical protein